jgi:RNA polymerase sigma-70 factor (ECF subfamily)
MVTALKERSKEFGSNLDLDVEQTYRETRDAVCAYVLYLGVPQRKAQEVTQEVFLRLCQTLRKGTPIENLRAWSFRVAHNLSLKVRSRERAFRLVSPNWERFAHPSESPESELLDRERNARVAATIEELSQQQRNCLYLRSQGLRYREIAEVMGISSSTVNEFLRRAIARLAEVSNE